ncbi:hypothetical protein [Phormidium sp. CCY1219]|uniref:hypothetical protein n=1 Tax=Phormidium sp. CCY1219 TaxID=2886104 RepID=UPI002D1F218F|nr:hypothetical protein [Phormidium sp. CCY1219]MEB3830019.1 hypothetical protein [Phormidium sp. CCY1219]
MRLIHSRATEVVAPAVGKPSSGNAPVVELPSANSVAIAPKTFVCPLTGERWVDSACAKSNKKLDDSCAWCPGAKLARARTN